MLSADYQDGPVTVHFGDALEVLRQMPSESVHCVVTEPQAAYLAGLIDGEGSLECQRQMQRDGATPAYRLRLSFTMATVEPLRTVGSWLGLRPLWYPATTENRQARWRLHIPTGLTRQILPKCLPYLLLKREQAQAILAIDAVRAANSPGRRHYGTAKLERMPTHAVVEMERLYVEFRRIKAGC